MYEAGIGYCNNGQHNKRKFSCLLHCKHVFYNLVGTYLCLISTYIPSFYLLITYLWIQFKSILLLLLLPNLFTNIQDVP